MGYPGGKTTAWAGSTWVGVLLFVLVATASAAPWSYEGETGPDYWGALSPDYAACAVGQRQSPINIETATVEPAPLPPIETAYREVPLRIVNNGHTIQVNYGPGSVLRVGERIYELRQFHFHAPSEEAIDGHRYPLVAHLVHGDEAGNLAVIAVLFDVDHARARGPNPALEPIWAHLPQEPGDEREYPDVTVQAMHLLPEDRSYYLFEGSLTTPPCTEGVSWFVLRTPVPISEEKLRRFTAIHPDNARPIQPTFGRTVQVSP